MVIEDKDTVDIIINMEEKVFNIGDLSPDGEITFDQVVGVARDECGLPSGPFIEYEVYYDNAIARPENGRLSSGQSVKIQDGTVFNVTYTDKS